MRGSTQKLTLAGREISLYLPPKALRGTPCRLLLAADGELLFEILTQLAGTLENWMAEENRGLILVGLTSQNRDADYTPWPAPGFDEEYPDFPGKAGEYLQWIDRELLPALRERWPISDQPEDVGILGFSLGGLLASYAPFVSPSFGYAMSLSGSNWYEGLIPFFAAHDPLTPCRFFLSYGRAEGAGKFSMQKDAAECAEAAAAALRSRLGEAAVTVTSDNGRHTTKRVSRYATALAWFQLHGQLLE